MLGVSLRDAIRNTRFFTRVTISQRVDELKRTNKHNTVEENKKKQMKNGTATDRR